MGNDRARAQVRFLPLFALAWAGAAIAYIPFLTILLPVRIEALAAVPGQGAVPVTWLGTIAFAGAIAASVGNIAFGWASDIVGGRRIWVAAGLALSAGLLLLSAQVTSFGGHVALLVCWQLALNMMIGPLSAWAGDLVPDAQKGRLGGTMAFAPAAGALTGALITLPGLAGPEGRLAIVALLEVCCVAPLLLFGAATPYAIPVQEDPMGSADLPARAVLLRMWLARLLVQVSEATLFVYLYFWLRSLDPSFSDATAARIFGGVLMVAAPLALVVGGWADREGKPLLPLRAAAALAAASLLLMGASIDPVVAIAGYAVFSLSSSVFLALHSAQTLRVLPRGNRRGRDLGLFNLTNTVPSLIMPGLTILMIPALGFRALFVLLAVLAFGAAALLVPARQR
jgi:MFS family permease